MSKNKEHLLEYDGIILKYLSDNEFSWFGIENLRKTICEKVQWD
jgi:hypothetical protein